MKKTKLTNFINKYYLSGRVNKAIWVVEDGVLKTSATTDSKDMIVEVAVSNMDIASDPMAVYDTDLLIKMLHVLDEDIDMEVIKIGNMTSAVKIKDSNSKLQFLLSNPDIIPRPTGELSEFPDWDLIIKFDRTFFERYKRAEAALKNETERVTIISNGNLTRVIIGYSTSSSDMVSIDVETEVANQLDPIYFNLKGLKEVLSNNPINKDTKMHISKRGLAYLEFVEDDIESKYYLLAMQPE